MMHVVNYLYGRKAVIILILFIDVRFMINIYVHYIIFYVYLVYFTLNEAFCCNSNYITK